MSTAEQLATGSVPHAGRLETIQKRTLTLLFATQIVAGIGMAIGFSVGALLAADMGGVSISGLAQSVGVVGGALLVVPATRIVELYGRRPSLTMIYLVAMLGSAIAFAGAVMGLLAMVFAGFFLFGGGTTAGLQARYAAVDLAPPEKRGLHLSLVVWATTIGTVTGPSLAPVAGTALERYGVPTLAAPFFFAALLLLLAACAMFIWMRPDPVIVAREARPATTSSAPRRAGMRVAFASVASNAGARLGIISAAIGHLVMVGVMSMTPVHVLGAGHDAAHTLRIVGALLSVHVIGMFAFSPLTGWLTDRLGRRAVILGGALLLVLAAIVASFAGHDNIRLGIALLLLGLGWSGTMVAGSTLLTDSVSAELRPSAQGLSDLLMGLAAAGSAALGGPVLERWGYPALAVAGGTIATVLVILAVRKPRTSMS